ncbi:MAG: FG-GAP-like repeat-containing protein [Opitutales bacterium]
MNLHLNVCARLMGFFALSAPLAAAALLESESLNPPSSPDGDTLFTTLDAATAGLDSYENQYGDPRMWGELYQEFTLGSVATGVATGDFDRDGRPDIYAVSKTGPNRLYRQVDDFVFEDVTQSAGVWDPEPAWNSGVSATDVNQDGWLDLYVARYDAPNRLYVNNGDGTFTEAAEAYGLDLVDASVIGSFADYDRDGDLDVYVQTNILDFSISPKGQRDYLLKNQGDGSFVSATREAGIYGLGQGHSAVWWDFNHDGWPDIYVANDFENPDKLYRNNGDGTFTDVLEEVLPYTSFFSMGSDMGDINNDGLNDFLVTDMAATTHYKDKTGMAELNRGIWETERVRDLTPQYMRNTLYLNTGSPRFKEVAQLAGIDETDWTWSVRFVDLDNDGGLDLHVTNGMIRNFIDADLLDRQRVAPNLEARARIFKNSPPLREHNLAFRNRGDLGFENVGPAWGLNHLGVSFGSSFSDLDRDGDLDLVFTNYEQGLTLVRNDSVDGNRLLIRLKGTRSHPLGIGAEVRIQAGDTTLTRQLYLARGAVSSDEPLVHFGLGEREQVDRLEVRWPSGLVQIFEDLRVNRFLTITEPAEDEAILPPAKGNFVGKETGFAEAADGVAPVFEHRENEFDEFARQFLLPLRRSRLGPGQAWGDADGDGRADVFIGGASGQPGALFLADADGGFTRMPDGPWDEHAWREDLGIAWLDLDGDGDLDLYVASGGAEYEPGSEDLADRVYRNEGKGGVTEATAELLEADTRFSGGSVVPADFDRDGDIDLFIAGRLVPGAYPDPPPSLLLENRDGRLVDVTADRAPGLNGCGMVTDAVFTDLTGDGRPDLFVVREWDTPMLWEQTRDGTFEDATEMAGLNAFYGLWNSVVACDVNEDGRIDLAVGNLGLNTDYEASPEKPVRLYYGDFDGNGSREHIEAQWEGDQLVPMRGMSKQLYAMPGMRRKFRSFDAFASADIFELYGEDNLSAADQYQLTHLESGVFLNEGGGFFSFEPLPRIAQVAPVFGMVGQDFTGDSRIDLLLVQNSYAPDPETGRYAGGVGQLLAGKGDGTFEPVPTGESGFVVTGDAKSLVAPDLNDDGWLDAFVTRNDDRTRGLLRKPQPGRNSFVVRLVGAPGNIQARGARVTVGFQDARSVTAELDAGGGYLSGGPPTLAFGYPDGNQPVAFTVIWPDGAVSAHTWTGHRSQYILEYP